MGKFSLKNKRAKQVSPDDAFAQVELFMDFYDVDFDDVADGLKKIGGDKAKDITGDVLGEEFMEMIEYGDIEIYKEKDVLKVKQYLLKPSGDHTEIVYGELKGSTRKSLVGENNAAQAFSLCSDLTKLPVLFFENMSSHDSKIAMQVASNFLFV